MQEYYEYVSSHVFLQAWGMLPDNNIRAESKYLQLSHPCITTCSILFFPCIRQTLFLLVLPTSTC